MPIVVNLDVMMAKRKMSSTELAAAIGITPANLSILKTNKAKAIRFSTLEALCKTLGCKPADILIIESNTMEHRKMRWARRARPVKVRLFRKQGRLPGRRAAAVPAGRALQRRLLCRKRAAFGLALGRYCLCPCVSGRGLAVLGTAGFPQLFARGPWHGCFLRFVCRRGAVLFIPGRKKAHAGKLVLAGRDAVPGAFLCPAVRGHAAGVLHYLALLLVAQYWVLCAAGRLLKQGKTSNWLCWICSMQASFCPGAILCACPPRFGQGQKQLAARRKSVPGGVRKGAGAKRVLAVLGGVLAGLLCLCIVLPPLMQADAGFAALFDGFTRWFSRFVENLFSSLNVGVFLVKCVLAVPTALFLYGTVYGSVRGRRTAIYQKQEVCGVQRGLRVLPVSLWARPCLLCARCMCCLLPCRQTICSALSGAQLPQGFPMPDMQGRAF